MQLRGKYAIAAAGLGLSACSQLMVPDVTAAGRFRNVKVARECSSSRAAPALDVGATVILGVIPAIVGVAAPWVAILWVAIHGDSSIPPGTSRHECRPTGGC